MSNKNTPTTPKAPSGSQSPFITVPPPTNNFTTTTTTTSTSSSSLSSPALTSTGIPIASVPLPAAHLFDIIPEVHELLSRLLPSAAHPPPPPSAAATATAAAAAAAVATEQTTPLEIQQLASAAAGVRIRLQKARAAVAELPDLDRTIAEQEGEMRELEERMERQRGVLRGLVGER